MSSLINQRKFKNKHRSITEASICASQANLQEKVSQLRQTKQISLANDRPAASKQKTSHPCHLPEYRPLKSEIICVGSIKQANCKKEEGLKKKHYRYLRVDTSFEANHKSISKSLTKSKTASTQSLRIHKIKSITREAKQESRQSQLYASDKAMQKRLGERMEEIKVGFIKLKETVNGTDEEEEINLVKSQYNKLAKRNKVIGIKILINSLKRVKTSKTEQAYRAIVIFSQQK